MVYVTLVMLAITGQLFSVSENNVTSGCSESRIDTFDSVIRYLSVEVQNLPIVYLPNSKFDRLLVSPAVYGSCFALIAEGSFKYVEQAAPIAPSPLKVATVGQILNANPFRQMHPGTDRIWLTMCVGNDGIADLALGQNIDPSAPCSSTNQEITAKVDKITAAELLEVTKRNQHNLNLARSHLPTPTDAECTGIAVLFDEERPRPKARSFAHDATPAGLLVGSWCSLQ